MKQTDERKDTKLSSVNRFIHFGEERINKKVVTCSLMSVKVFRFLYNDPVFSTAFS